ncbi:MAG: hypothetical protein A2Z95_03340 [Gallionellales bacterium GWA2_60_18]|nr:MAG: hypothetical protein A2Z95_03340 [Gallionellales bacterium GWA2_60_18]
MATGQISDAITQAFCADCRERVLRASEIVQDGVPLDGAQLDCLHQEFDTLFGGARAAHLPELEHYFRQMARYARHLRNWQASGLPVDRLSWQILLDGIEAAPCCGAGLPGFIGKPGNERALLAQRMENIIGNGEAS